MNFSNLKIPLESNDLILGTAYRRKTAHSEIRINKFKMLTIFTLERKGLTIFSVEFHQDPSINNPNFSFFLEWKTMKTPRDSSKEY